MNTLATTEFHKSCKNLVQHLKEQYKDWVGAKQFEGTPDRIYKMYLDFCWPPERLEKELSDQFRVFENSYGGMLVTGPITVWVLCPHHLLPCRFTVVVGCISSGKVLGLSKFARIAEIMGKRPIMQEQYSIELADELMERLKPKGIAVYVTGSHDCMVARGVKQDSKVVTSVLRGDFMEHPTRDEFFSIAESRLR